MWIHVYPDWKTKFNSKNGIKRSFSYKTKSSISFIPMRRIWLWCPIMKWKKIIMWIRVSPNWKMNFNSKNVRKKSFSYETKALIPFITMRKTCLWCSIMIWKEIIMWIHVYPNWKWTLFLKMVEREAFLMKPMHQFIYPSAENEFMVPNH